MKELTIAGKEYGIVSVPEGATDITIDELITPYLQYWQGDEDTAVDLPPGQWKLIGRLKDIDEKGWRGIVELCEHFDGFYGYRNYLITGTYEKHALESGHSLMKANGFEMEDVLLEKIK